jgi:L-threonylcarbamoyladenylate synthase
MDIRGADQVKLSLDDVARDLAKGKTLLYPTDTVYGLGCDATNDDAVRRIREAKNRPEKPLSVIAPSKRWIFMHCDVPDDAEPSVNSLPGPYTYIFETTESELSAEVSPGLSTLGVRYPHHWIVRLVKTFQRPIITTSANLAGDSPVQTPAEASEDLAKHVDIAIDNGAIDGTPSTIVDYSGDEPERIPR